MRYLSIFIRKLPINYIKGKKTTSFRMTDCKNRQSIKRYGKEGSYYWVNSA